MTKHEKLWRECRRLWVKLHPPNFQGYYICWICHGWVHESEMELDHIIARSRRPDLRYILTNLAPSHHLCNTVKGSSEHKEIVYDEVALDDIW